jgi:UDPglucose--hexose-1-phosphate uridylyltransferase
MPELRRDPILDRWVVVAPERADRPNALLRAPPEEDDAEGCPFCPGNEAMTPPELLSLRDANGSWYLRVVPNRYPALRSEVQLARRAAGLYDQIAGVGAHEVLIDTAEHGRKLHEQPVERIEALLRAAQARMTDLARDVRLRSAIFFKNSGAAGGASLSHSHSQLLALPVVPAQLALEMQNAAAHFARKERCLFCELLAQELAERTRVVVENEAFVVLSPYAARSPFELLMLPREHRSSFESSTEADLRAFASALRTSLRKLDLALERPAYNFWLHTQPMREPPSASFHFHLELKPVLSLFAGFEWGSGFTINPIPPEEAAAFLQKTEA